MFRVRRIITAKKTLLSGAVIAAGVFSGKTILAEGRPPPHMITESELPSLLTEKHGEDNYVYYDLSELPSIGEDGNCQGVIGQLRCFGIFDGHAGWCTSNHVSQTILSYISKSLEKQRTDVIWPLNLVYSKRQGSDLSSEEIDEAIKDAFVNLDNDILRGPQLALQTKNLQLASEALPLAASGSCAMMAFYNPLNSVLKIALAGDSRAVLGVQDPEGVWHSRNLTIDQTGETPSEIARIRAEHPNDSPDILRGGRILGFQPTRSFGDARTKYASHTQNELRTHFWWRRPNPLLKTPPYMTAKPVVTTVALDPKRPAFMVLGCDGLYEWLSNAQVVDLVGRWLDENPVIFVNQYAGTVDESNDDSAKSYLRPEILKWGELKPIVKDKNVGTHLIRNALGGADFDKMSMLMSIPAPTSRAYRDDITCTVVFFKPAITSKL